MFQHKLSNIKILEAFKHITKFMEALFYMRQKNIFVIGVRPTDEDSQLAFVRYRMTLTRVPHAQHATVLLSL